MQHIGADSWNIIPDLTLCCLHVTSHEKKPKRWERGNSFLISMCPSFSLHFVLMFSFTVFLSKKLQTHRLPDSVLADHTQDTA